MDNAVLTKPFFNIVGYCNFTEAESHEVQFTGQGAISQKTKRHNKTLRLALEYIKNCRSGIPFVTLSCLDGQILVQKCIKFDQLLVQSNISVLAVKNTLMSVSLFMSCFAASAV